MIYSRPAAEKNAYKSILFSTEDDLSFLDGSVLWICESPIRPHHKRKNWYIDVSIIDAGKDSFQNVSAKNTMAKSTTDSKDIRFERFHSGGNGGQNVNKVETGVRLIYIREELPWNDDILGRVPYGAFPVFFLYFYEWT